ncbi:MAG: biopolymer transporter ExbD, partial [Planctomycetota bacterium]
IDVTFLLLLFFMLSFTFREYEGQIKAALPGGGPDVVPRMPIAVRVRSEGVTGARYEIEGVNEAIRSPARLGEVLGAIRQQTRSDSPVMVRPDAFVQWGHVVEAVNQAVRMKFSHVQIDPLS